METSDDIKAEFTRLFLEEKAHLFGYIHTLVYDRNDAEDLFQSLVLWCKFSEFDRQRNFFLWACGIARLEVALFLRSRARQRLYFSDEVNLLLVEAQVRLSNDEMDDRREALRDCVQKLRRRDQELLDAGYSQPGGVRVVAEGEGRSPQSVHNSLRRIRQSLSECIDAALRRQARPEPP